MGVAWSSEPEPEPRTERLVTESVIPIAVGLVALVVGGEVVVRGASTLAAAARIPPVVIGLTVVALGTSSPELAVAVGSALRGEPDFVIGNVVGSNIYNVLLVLGASALVVPLVVHRALVRWDVPVMIAASVALLVAGGDGELSRLDGAVMVAALVGYLGFAVIRARRESRRTAQVRAQAAADAGDEFERRYRPLVGRGRLTLHVAILVGGLALLVVGADLIVDGAVSVAETLGLDRLMIGLTVVALGTSLPELATSITAAFRGERDLAVGNIVGSNLMNILAVAGITGVATSGGVVVADAAINFDLPVMIAVAVACLPIFFTGHCIQRWEGALFLGYAAAYTAYLVLDATEHRLLPAFSGVMLAFVVPITVLTLALITFRSIRPKS